MARNPSRGSGTREQVLESAIQLMRQSGLTGAGINQVLSLSGAPKGSMYYHFPEGKLQIVAEALELYGERVAANFEAALSSKRNPRDKIVALFRAIAERLEQADFDQSCAAGAVALDLNADVEAIRPVVNAVMTSWCGVLGRHLPLRTRAQTDSFASLVLSAVEGGYIQGRAQRSTAALRDAGRWLALLYELEAGQ